MKIRYVVHQFLPDYFTGTESYVHAVALAMRGHGHDVSVFTLDPKFGEEAEPWRVERLEVDQLPVERVRYWNRLHRDVQRLEHAHPLLGEHFGRGLDTDRPDVVHFFHLRFLGANLLDEARRRGIATVVHLMDFWFLCPRVILLRGDGSLCDGPPEGGLGCIPCVEPKLWQQLQQWDLVGALREVHATRAPAPSRPGSSLAARAAAFLERPASLRDTLLRADRIVAPSRFLAGVFAANGYPQERIQVCAYGIDPARVAGGERSVRPAGSARRFGFVGSLAPHKGLDVAVRAVLRCDAPLELQVWGRVDDFADYAGRLRDAHQDDPRVRFCGSFPRERLGAVLAGLDVLVVPSQWYENTPFVVLEAMAAGVPVLASDLGGIAEVVEHERNGELFPRGDAAALARAMVRLTREPARLDRYRAALPRATTLQDNAAEFEALYTEAIDNAEAKARSRT